MKRILSLILVLVMVLGVMPMASATTPSVTVAPDKSAYTAGETLTLTLSVPTGYTASNIQWPWPGGTAGTDENGNPTYSITTTIPAEGTAYSYSVICDLTPTTENTTGTSATGVESNTATHNVYTASTSATIELGGAAAAKTNQNVQLTATVLPATLADKSVSYSVSPTDGASVSSTGVFTATKAGTYTVTATSNGKTATLKITVTASDYVVSPVTVTVYPGQEGVPVAAPVVKQGTTTLTYGTDYTVAWGVGINDGMLTPVSASTTISGTVSVGEETYPVTCTVNVVKVAVSCVNGSAGVGGTVSFTPSASITGYTKPIGTVEYVYGTGLTAASNSNSSAYVSKSSAGIYTYAIDAKIDGKTNAAAPVTVKASFYTDADLEVTMLDGVSAFDFDSTASINGNVDLAAKVRQNSNVPTDNSQRVKFGKTEDNYGKLTLPQSGGVDWVNMGGSTRGLGDVRFTVLNDAYGYWVTSYKLLDSVDSNLIYGTGTITINFDDVTASIVYKTTSNKAVTFDEDDFDDYWEACGMSGYPEYVVFDGQPYYGNLYTTAAMKTKTDDTDRFYYGATGSQLDLDAVTYNPYKLASSYDDEIGFTMYGDDTGEEVHGIVVIEVGEKMNFTDVKTTDYFYNAVQWAVGEDITSGTSATTFSPNKTCTRAEVVTFLYRAAGEPAVTGYLPFTDVDDDAYYYDAVLWAYKNDITTGLTSTTFGPHSTVTRGQVVTFLWRAMDELSVSASNPFNDVKRTDYFYEAVLWAVKNDVTTGLTSTTFGPNSGCTRGQIVTFLYRAYEGE